MATLVSSSWRLKLASARGRSALAKSLIFTWRVGRVGWGGEGRFENLLHVSAFLFSPWGRNAAARQPRTGAAIKISRKKDEASLSLDWEPPPLRCVWLELPPAPSEALDF